MSKATKATEIKFSVNRAELLKELALLQLMIDKKQTVPMLSHINVQAELGRLSLSATDLEVSLSTSCAAVVEAPGSVALPGKKLVDIAKSVTADRFDVSVSGNDWATIQAGKSEFKVAGLSSESFPALPVWPKDQSGYSLPASIMNGLIKRTSFAITNEESRYGLHGALIETERAGLLMVATDGHRLAVAKSSAEIQDRLNVKIPKRALTAMSLLTDGRTENLEFVYDSNHFFLRLGGRLFSSTLLAGQFPEWRRVVPQDNPHEGQIATPALLAAVKRVDLMTDDQSHGVKFSLAENTLTLQARAKDTGEAKDIVAIDFPNAQIDVGMNARYILEFLAVAGDPIKVSVKSDETPVLFSERHSGFDYQYVVMPMRLDFAK